MSIPTRLHSMFAVVALATAVAMPAIATAQTAPVVPADGTWRFGAALYLYLPSIDGNMAFPTRGGDASISVNSDSIFDSVNGAFMGTLEANNGRWGVFTDFLYVDVSGSNSGTRDFQIGNSGAPSSVTANLDLKLKGSAWTIAGEYRLAASRAFTMDALAGARLLNVKPRLSWSLAGDLAGVPTAGRGGNNEIEANNWDAIIGVKGRYALGDSGRWSLPFYADVGTGDSDLTWQVAGGLSYAFGWGDVLGMWRYLKYDMKSGQPVADLSFNGPMIGVVFHW